MEPTALFPIEADATPPGPARSADAARERISTAEASSVWRARKALIFSRTCKGPKFP